MRLFALDLTDVMLSDDMHAPGSRPTDPATTALMLLSRADLAATASPSESTACIIHLHLSGAVTVASEADAMAHQLR